MGKYRDIGGGVVETATMEGDETTNRDYETKRQDSSNTKDFNRHTNLEWGTSSHSTARSLTPTPTLNRRTN